jgi:hypothetical protein
VLDLGRGERAAVANLVEHPGHQAGLLCHDPRHAAPRVRAGVGHPPAEQRLQVDGDQRGLVAPELEQLAGPAVGRPLEQRRRVRPQAAVERHEVGALQHVDRVHLDQVQAAQHPAQVPHVGAAPGRRIEEALGGQGDAPSLRDGERFGYGHRAGR